MTIISFKTFLDDRSKANKPPSTGSRRTHKRREQRKRNKNKMFAAVHPQISNMLDSIKIKSITGISDPMLGSNATPDYAYGQANTAQKKGKPMCYDCDCNESTVENRKLTYVQNRVDSLHYAKRNELRKMFKLDDDSAPTTAKDLLDRIEKKQYQLKTDEEQKMSCYYFGGGALIGFRWRAEDSKPDQAGYDAAETELNEFAKAVELKATVGTADQQIEAIQSLVDWQPSNKPS